VAIQHVFADNKVQVGQHDGGTGMTMSLAVTIFVTLAEEGAWYKDPTTLWTVIAASGATILLIVWGGVRFWVGTTRGAKIKEVHTPTLDRMNASALERFSGAAEGEEAEEPEENEAPADLLAVVPEEEEKKPEAGSSSDVSAKTP
jgi:hypothetical protein